MKKKNELGDLRSSLDFEIPAGLRVPDNRHSFFGSLWKGPLPRLPFPPFIRWLVVCQGNPLHRGSLTGLHLTVWLCVV